MELFGALASPYVARVEMAARILGIDLKSENPDGWMKSEAHKAINPMMKIPAFTDGELKLGESEVIVEYLCDKYPDKAAALRPGDASALATARLISRVVDLYLIDAAFPMMRQMNPAERDEDFVAKKTEETKTALGYLEALLVGPYAAGSQVSQADCTLLTTFNFLNLILHGIGQPGLLDAYPKLKAWWHQVSEADPVTAGFCADHKAAIDSFMAMMRSRQAGG